MSAKGAGKEREVYNEKMGSRVHRGKKEKMKWT
jgi:hypothetical protein